MRTQIMMLCLVATILACKKTEKPAAEIMANANKTETLVIKTESSEQTFTFDPAVISKADLQKYEALVAACPPRPWIEDCGGDRGYLKPCGKSNYEANAELNLKHFEEERKKYITATRELPAELQPASNSCQKELDFYGTIQTRLYKFFKTRDLNLLKEKILTFDPQILAANEIELASNETDPEKQYNLVKYQWYNKVNSAFRNEFDKLKRPHEVWDDYLKLKNIKVETKCLSEACAG